VGAGRRLAQGRGADIVEISLPHTRHALPAYYIIAPAEASSNLARYDGVRYGLRERGRDITDMYEKTPGQGLWRRGAPARDDRHLCALGRLLRRLLRARAKNSQPDQARLRSGFRQWRRRRADAGDAFAAFAMGEKGSSDPVEMYLNDVFTVTVNMAGLPGIAVPAGLPVTTAARPAIDRPAVPTRRLCFLSPARSSRPRRELNRPSPGGGIAMERGRDQHPP